MLGVGKILLNQVAEKQEIENQLTGDRSLTANIALEMAYALDNHRSALFVNGLLLLSVIILLAIAAELVKWDRV
ncbi:MAG: hypothetical protein AB4206_07220 [Xenococcaceae cyanobacterium]